MQEATYVVRGDYAGTWGGSALRDATPLRAVTAEAGHTLLPDLEWLCHDDLPSGQHSSTSSPPAGYESQKLQAAD